MRRKFWGVFGILTIVLTGLATGLFFVVHQSDNGEPNTNLTATSSTSIYTKEQYFDTMPVMRILNISSVYKMVNMVRSMLTIILQSCRV